MKDLATRLGRCTTSSEMVEQYIDHLKNVLDTVPVDTISAILETVEEAANRGSTVFFIGNGGSASIASHFVNDLVYGTRCEDHPSVRAVSVTDNLAVVTALANDNGYHRCFVMQLEANLRPNDVVIALSASGNSPNVVEALQYARDVGATVISCTGFRDGEMRKFADIDLHLDLPHGEYGPAEDVFMVLDHMIYSCIRFRRRNRL